jgi:glycerol-3-phosphate dehydrogenase
MNNKVMSHIKTKVIVIGAGIAGSSIAGDLTRRGYEVHLYDKNDCHAKETSAHETALAHPQVGKNYLNFNDSHN